MYSFLKIRYSFRNLLSVHVNYYLDNYIFKRFTVTEITNMIISPLPPHRYIRNCSYLKFKTYYFSKVLQFSLIYTVFKSAQYLVKHIIHVAKSLNFEEIV